MRGCRAEEERWPGLRSLRRLLLPLALMAALVGCNEKVGVAPNLQGTYWEHALVTNPNGGGPQVVIWGPPDNRLPTMP